MKALILAAGRGSRLSKYTTDRPKGMLKLGEKTLIEWQVEYFKNCSIKHIGIITGYMADKIDLPLYKFHNKHYASTNMIESLMCARKFMDDDIIISYADIFFEPRLLRQLLESKAEISILADANWKKYWKFRYNTTEKDLESFEIDNNGCILSLGVKLNSSSGIKYRYVGLNKINKSALDKAFEIYDSQKTKKTNWTQSGNTFKQGYMTDWIHEMIRAGMDVKSVICHRGWYEIDTNEDYEKTYKLFLQHS